MGYKEEFIDSIKSLHTSDIDKKKAIEGAEDLIHDYFSSLEKELEEYFEIAESNLKFKKTKNFYKIEYNGKYFSVSFMDSVINIEVRPMGLGYKETLKFSNKELKFFSQQTNIELSEELLDKYLKDTFENVITFSANK